MYLKFTWSEAESKFGWSTAEPDILCYMKYLYAPPPIISNPNAEIVNGGKMINKEIIANKREYLNFLFFIFIKTKMSKINPRRGKIKYIKSKK